MTLSRWKCILLVVIMTLSVSVNLTSSAHVTFRTVMIMGPGIGRVYTLKGLNRHLLVSVFGLILVIPVLILVRLRLVSKRLLIVRIMLICSLGLALRCLQVVLNRLTSLRLKVPCPLGWPTLTSSIRLCRLMLIPTTFFLARLRRLCVEWFC